MTKDLARVLTNLFETIKDWNAGLVPTEEDFLFSLEKEIVEVVEELKKQKEKKIQTKI